MTREIADLSPRFSQDLQLIDMELPLSVLNTILTFFTCVAQMVVICTSTGYIAATIPACDEVDGGAVRACANTRGGREREPSFVCSDCEPVRGR